ncbi:hypothetical protein NSS82_10350 [Paenibacillus sp. FSL H7-0735]|uniref:hypothetical protein n=1 Tax=Paenibacillus sp. FSL H7-0735 TaxID=2954736 RepID=UPI0030F56DE4
MAEIQLIKGAANGNPPDSLPTLYQKVNNSMTNINTQVVNHEGRIGTAEATVSDHGSRITDAETELINQDERISNIVSSAGDSNTEIVDARQPAAGTAFPILGDRLNNFDAQLADTESDLRDREVNVKSLGLIGNGSDESASLAAAINYVADNHYTLLIPRDMTIFADSITISNKSSFGIRCEGIIKRLDDSPTVGALLRLEYCSDVSIPLINFNGNGLNNGCDEMLPYTSTQEQKHSLVIYGCSRVRIGDIHSHNSCGDVVYITNDSTDIIANSVNGTADAYIGRNIVSIISAQNIDITSIIGSHFGHYQMPGGFDIEPNANTEIVRNVHVGIVRVEGGGTLPCAVQNTNGSTTENVTIDSVNIIHNNVKALGSGAETGSIQLAGSSIKLSNAITKNNTSFNITSLIINNFGGTAKGVSVSSLYATNCYRGLSIGFNGMVEDVVINAVIRNAKFDGIDLFQGRNMQLHVDINSVGSDRFMINKPVNGPLENVKISGDISKRGTGLRALITGDTAVNIVNLTLENLNFTGWSNGERLSGTAFGNANKINCLNLTDMSAKPTSEQWKVGDVVTNNAPIELGTAGSKYIIEKWIAVAAGSGSSIFRDSRVLTGN